MPSFQQIFPFIPLAGPPGVEGTPSVPVAARASRAALNAVRKNSVTICRIRIRRFVLYTKPRDERRG
jgi:hypothetical protein